MKSKNRYPNDHSLTKPHIYWFGGYWRVTKFPGLGQRTRPKLVLWNQAHDFVAKLNARLLPSGREIYLKPPL
jgi:hypothetical protein